VQDRAPPRRGARDLHESEAQTEAGVKAMARIAGVDLPRTKRVEIGLTYIYGIGRVRSNKILTEAGVSADIRIKDLSEPEAQTEARVNHCGLWIED